MSTHKHFEKICCVILILTIGLTVFFVNAEKFGVEKTSTVMEYESRLFDTTMVHTIEIEMDDWESFLSTCTDEEYVECDVTIDGECYNNVAIRAKGNTSLTQVESYGNDRYSFKIEFDHYDSTKTYYGLDKLCLNNIIQDNTYMKDYLSYQIMAEVGVASPLCSYVNISVNGETWGLYLAVEAIEESFLQRNYGKDYGELYKPDSVSMGGGRGNGKNFDMDEFQLQEDSLQEEQTGNQQKEQEREQRETNRGGSNSSEDVLLKYIDDEIESYSNIFENAKTDVTEEDQERLIASLKSLSLEENLEEILDTDRVIRYFVAHNFLLNFDSYTGSMVHNYYLYEKDGQLQMLPWDYNLAFGGFESASDTTSLVNYPIDTPVSGDSIEERPMLSWIFSSEEYTELYHQYFSEFIASYFTSGEFETMMDSVKEMITPYVEEDPTKFCTFEEFETGIDTLKTFCLLRAESIQGQLDGTIGSTKETQESDTLVDAGDLSVSDMGSMNQTMQGGQPGGLGEMPEMPQGEQGEMPEMPQGEQGEMPEMPQGEQGEMPEIPQGDMPQGNRGERPDMSQMQQNGQEL